MKTFVELEDATLLWKRREGSYLTSSASFLLKILDSSNGDQIFIS